MEKIDTFEAVFGSNPEVAYNQNTIEDIARNRRALENLLFVDRLLKALGIEKSTKLYPPRSAQDLRNLHGRIMSSESPDHHKLSILYYLLKDIPNSRRQAAMEFARAFYLPEKYRIFVDGLWYLDKLKFERALEYLTEPALIPTFPEEILHTLCRHASEHDSNLPLAYYHSVSPSIASDKVLEAFFFVLCRSSITEAFYFSREQGEFFHQSLFEKLISFVLAHSSGSVRARRSVELISLPLDDEEGVWFEGYLKDGEGRELPGAGDTVIMRGLARGDPTFLLEHGKDIAGRKIDGVSWATLRESLQRGQGHDTAQADVLMS